MNAGILTQIMVTPYGRYTQQEAREAANKLGFKMYSFNNRVYSVKSDDELFLLSDFVNYNYTASL